MIVISGKKITKEYGVEVILEDVTFHINKGDRVGLVGPNGAGKTTLLKILAGEATCDQGEFFVSAETTIGYLKQKEQIISHKTVIEEVEDIFKPLKEMEVEIERLAKEIAAAKVGSREQEILMNKHHDLAEEFRAKGGYTYLSTAKGVLTSMAFAKEQYAKPVSTLSGGERTRLSLAILLLKKPDLLLLDEPTNHLDIGTLKWLEQYLRGYEGTVLVVSHDRYFLDRMVNRIFELEERKLYKYEGNYSQFAEKKRLRRQEEQRRYGSLKKEKEKQEEIIRRFKSHGTEKLAKRAASREKKLAKTMDQASINQIEAPKANGKTMKIKFKEKFQSGKDVLKIEGISKTFGYGGHKRKIFDNVSMDIKRGDRICLVGPNGIGKTTLMKILMEEISPDQGYIKKGHNVHFGYYDQGQHLLKDENTVIEELQEAYGTYTQTELRTILGSFLFQGDSVFLSVGALSGGEKARLSLLKLMLGGANVLLLDEPTNHLDIESKEVFEEALLHFPGAVVIVSHDRYFLSKIPTKIMELGRDGMTSFLGNYEYYVEKKQTMESGKQYLNSMGKSIKEPLAKGEAGCKDEGDALRDITPAELRKIKKEEEANQRRAEREKGEMEREIEKTEEDIGAIEEEMCLPEVLLDHKKLGILDKELSDSKEKLEQLYEKWLQY